MREVGDQQRHIEAAFGVNRIGWIVRPEGGGWLLAVRLPDGSWNVFSCDSYESAMQDARLLAAITREGDHGEERNRCVD